MKKRIKKFFDEFKTFVSRGNVLDMAVGVIVGGAFTAIVNGMSEYILRPIVNWLLALVLGKNSLSELYTFLIRGYSVSEESGQKVLDLSQSVYIDWGAFVNAIINFFLIAFVLFSIVKTINRMAEANEKMKADLKTEREALKKYRKSGLKKADAIARYREDLRAEAEAKAAEEAKKQEELRLAAEKEAREKEEKELAATRLLEEIRDLLKNK